MSGASDSFHAYLDDSVRAYQTYTQGVWSAQAGHSYSVETRDLTYRFYLHAHPYVQELVQRLIDGSVQGLQDADTDYVTNPDGTLPQLIDTTGSPAALADGTPVPRPVLYDELFSPTNYMPSNLVDDTQAQPYPVKDLDFTARGAYAGYNWELFYHIPLTVAIQLSQNQRYEDALRWFGYVFDPTDDSAGPTPERFWKVKPLQYTDAKLIEEILVNLSTGADPALQADTIASIGQWKANPFRPFAVARYRPTAFKFKAVTAYLDNLIAWGDSLFAQYTGETINEAAQLYILAAEILGPKPQAIPKKDSLQAQTYATLRKNLTQFGNALVEIEDKIGFDAAPHPNGGDGHAQLVTLSSIGKAEYFCVPRNDQLLAYWDTVADRLFKIHNSLNLEGVFQRVPLFEPPIDPALLARAAAAGLDVGAIVSGLNQPLPLVRFQYLAGKAAEMCAEVKSLGNNLLSAIEKRDNEAYAILRAKHETIMLTLAETVKYSAYQEAIKSREGLEQSIANVTARYVYYERLLGKQPGDIKIPALDPIDAAGLEKMAFSSAEPAVAKRGIPVDIKPDVSGLGGGKKLSSHEVRELVQLKNAHELQHQIAMYDKIGAAMSTVPNFSADIHPMGCGSSISFGGSNLAAHMTLLASFDRTNAEEATYEAGLATKVGAYARREAEWAFQSNVVAGEIAQLFKQLRAAQIREALAQHDWKNHQTQIAHAQEIEQFLTDDTKGKTTNLGFYVWMKREVKALYGQCFQLAFDVARKAERALQQELGDPNLAFVKFGYLAGKEGLLAGEKLWQDVKRMELAYAELNRREYELTKHVSLLQLDPIALLRLRETGSCTVTFREELFDLDWPAYFRRIRSVAVSIPSVVGPYTSLNCRLTLLKSSIRVSTLRGSGETPYARDGADDARFSDFFGSVQSMLTSGGQSDSGLFDPGTRDERKHPFEWAGAVSQWQLDLQTDVRQFDFSTIADVVVHLRYTAREGGDAFRGMATKNLQDSIKNAQANGSVRLFSIRHEFPTEWAKFTSVALGGNLKVAPLTIVLRPEHYPFWSAGRLNAIRVAKLYAKKSVTLYENADGTGKADTLAADPSLGDMHAGSLTHVGLPKPTGPWTLYADGNTMDDLFVALTWGDLAAP